MLDLVGHYMNKNKSLNEIVDAISLEQGKKNISTIQSNSPKKDSCIIITNTITKEGQLF